MTKFHNILFYQVHKFLILLYIVAMTGEYFHINAINKFWCRVFQKIYYTDEEPGIFYF
jgi:hypothetical protein